MQTHGTKYSVYKLKEYFPLCVKLRKKQYSKLSIIQHFLGKVTSPQKLKDLCEFPPAKAILKTAYIKYVL